MFNEQAKAIPENSSNPSDVSSQNIDAPLPNLTETKDYRGATIEKVTYDARKLIEHYWGEGSFDSLRRRKPDLEIEPTISLTVVAFPPDAVPDFYLGNTFQHIAEKYKLGMDILGIGSGTVSGAKIAEVKAALAKEGYLFPKRREEYDEYVEKMKPGKKEAIWQFQVGGWPWNDGSVLYKKGIYAITQDHLFTDIYEDSPFSGRYSPFSGLAVYKDGTKEFVTVLLNTTSYETFRSSLEEMENIDIFIGTPISLVEKGKALSLRNIIHEKSNSDPRHLFDLPYWGNPSYYGKALSGSIFFEEIQEMLRQGEGHAIWEYMQNGKEMEIELYPDSLKLLEAALSDKEGIKELERVGLNIENLKTLNFDLKDLENSTGGENGRKRKNKTGQKVSFAPQPALYNHLAWGITKDNCLAIAMTSGLIEGVKSGKLGVPADILAHLLAKRGFKSATFGSQGRDVPQVFCNREMVSDLWDATVERYHEKIEEKEATTPSIFARYQIQKPLQG